MSRIAAVLVAVSLAVAGCSGGDGPSSGPSSEPSSVPPSALSEFATDTLTIARADFCSQVPPGSVEDALGGAADSADAWANGDRARLANGLTDVAHEYGCRWVSADGTTAQGWVFAPPVTRGEAEKLRRAAAKAPGCHAVPDAPPFGTRSVAVRCDDGTTAFHGLFGDAWLSCSLRTPAADTADLVDRAGRWCVAVAQAAAA
jgi:hypothetical protein